MFTFTKQHCNQKYLGVCRRGAAHGGKGAFLKQNSRKVAWRKFKNLPDVGFFRKHANLHVLKSVNKKWVTWWCLLWMPPWIIFFLNKIWSLFHSFVYIHILILQPRVPSRIHSTKIIMRFGSCYQSSNFWINTIEGRQAG